ncbi:MAG: hypothetical protein ACYTKD_24880 [Planctomycetota bacterium]
MAGRYVRIWDGRRWGEPEDYVALTGTGTPDGGVASVSMVLDRLGAPVVAWRYADTNGPNPEFQVYVARRAGRRRWRLIGRGPVSPGGAGPGTTGWGEVSLALGPRGHPFLAYEYRARVHLKRWDGEAWVELGGSASGRGPSAIVNSCQPRLRVDSSGKPVIAWATCEHAWDIYAMRWNGESWAELAGSASEGGVSKRGDSGSPSLALDAHGNPYVAWNDGPEGACRIYLRYWDGKAWAELGGSGSGDGISGKRVHTVSCRLALDAGGEPVVAWSAGGALKREIFIKRWDGAAWTEVGRQSAAGGGISATPGMNSWQPAITMDPLDRPVVAWRDGTGTYLRRYQFPLSRGR